MLSLRQLRERSAVAKRYYVFNAGCIRRGLDCIIVDKYLSLNGWRRTSSARRADLVVVSTCGVVAKNEQNSLKAVEKALQLKSPQAEMVILGCLPEINPGSLLKLGNFYHVPSGQLSRLDRLVDPEIPMEQVPIPDSVTDGGSIVDYLIARSFCRRSLFYRFMFDRYAMNGLFLRGSVRLAQLAASAKRFFGKGGGKIVPYFNIRLGDGCLSECTYCATRRATGRLRSRPLENVLADFDHALAKQYAMIQLVSEDTGCYGIDIGTNISGLLSVMFEREEHFQLILIDFNPWWLVRQQEALIPLLAANQDRVKEIFMPFQSGSDRILAAMKREYTAEQVMSVFKRLRETAPSIAIRTCALVGFPGETDEDFEATCRMIREVDFAEVAVNRYEDRPNTPSSVMEHKVPGDVIEKRAWMLVHDMNCRMLS